ncbi:hypothetical protein, partial [Spirulina sp. 06S082]|uniref:hypothetical protein n=1 Tax=Spirulina sp. 06S082 TaxID=3110248 RepID=UPI002B1F71A6
MASSFCLNLPLTFRRSSNQISDRTPEFYSDIKKPSQNRKDFINSNEFGLKPKSMISEATIFLKIAGYKSP